MNKWLRSALVWGAGLVLLLMVSVFCLYPMPFRVGLQPISEQPFITQTTLDKVNINQAPKEELALLPGIGDKRAAAIVEYRTAQGNFERVEDLLLVSGIGEKTLANIEEFIIV